MKPRLRGVRHWINRDTRQVEAVSPLLVGRMTMSQPPVEIEATFADQARKAARDPQASERVLRDGLESAANIIDAQTDFSRHLIMMIGWLRLQRGIASGLIVVLAIAWLALD